MKIFRRLFFLVAVVFFFLLGISAADKEYLYSGVVGICISSEDQDLPTQICDYIAQSCFADSQALYQQLKASQYGFGISRGKRYFDAASFGMGHIPDGVYDTIVIDQGGEGCSEAVFLIQLKPLNHRFIKTTAPVASVVQEYYISFLSVIGKAEKLVIEFAEHF